MGFSLLCHAIQWIRRATQDSHGLGIKEFLMQSELYAWTPGFFAANEVHLLVNWVFLCALSGYLIFGKYNRVILMILLAVAISHFFALPARVSNHYIVLLWAIGILAFMPSWKFEGQTPNSTPLAVSLLRHLTLTTYFFAVFHKLNATYFSTEESALTAIFPDGVYTLFGVMEKVTGLEFQTLFFTFLIPISIIVELAIPILLAMRKTRLVGWVCGLIFHASITYLCGIIDYTVVILSFYILFLSKEDYSAFIDRLRQFTRRKIWVSAVVMIAFESLPLSMGSAQARHPDFASGLIWYTEQAVGYLVIFVIVYVLYTVLEWMVDRRTLTAPAEYRESEYTLKNSAGSLRRRQGVVALVIFINGIYILNGLAPYLGAKYYYSQTMFSNLKVDPTHNNHFIFPEWRIFENDSYFKVLHMEFSPEVEDNFLNQNRGLELLLNNYEQHLVEKNFLFSVLSHACTEGEFGIAISFVEETHQSKLVLWSSVRGHLDEMEYHPFNFYPWFKLEE